ncbi:MAG: TonB-dependent receptor domain-containing protein [Janthinobacterium lividum]
MFRLKLAFQTIALGLFCSLLAIRPAAAQNTTGSIVGTINDTAGATVANATVTVINKATNDKRTVVSSSGGEYQSLNLQPGQYRIEIEVPGFKRYVRDPVEVQVELASRINVDLSVGDVNETVTVTSQAPIIQSENAALGQVVQGRAVQEIPLNGRNVLALVGLVPGVVPQGSSSGNLTGQNVFAAGNYQIGGGSANQSSTLYDGAPVNVSYGNATILVPSQDTVQEFRVQTSNNTAEYGNYTGGVINITSKSGTNSIHGTVYEYVRNTIFNSTPYFARHYANSSQYLPKNPLHQNQFGANIGFPIIKDKLFGFFDYQGFRLAQSRLYTNGPATVPTQLMKTGNFSELCTTGFTAGICNPLPGGGSGTASTNTNQVSYQLYDPCGGTVAAGQACPNYTGPRTPFLNNIIPTSRFSNVARNLLNFPYWANPNSTGTANNGTTGNFRTYTRSGGMNNQYNGRLDFTLSDRQRIFGRYTQWNSGNQAAQPFGNGLLAGDPVSPEAFKTYQTVVGDTYLFNPSTIGDIRVSYTRWNYKRTPGTLGYNETQLGFPSYFGNIDALNSLSPSTTLPAITLSNPTVNNVGTGLIISVNQNYVVAPTLTKTIKSHTLKAGADLRRLEEQYFQNNAPGGTFAFDNTFTGRSASNATGSGNPFASFLLGYAASGVVQIAPTTYNTVYYQGYYVQDNWIVNSKLTLNLGIRYEIPGTYRERNNRQATFNPTEVNPLLQGVTVNGNPVLGAFDLVASTQHPAAGLRNEHFSEFSPRLGLAYRITDSTVLRAGWGRFLIPSTLQFPESPVQSPLNYLNNNVTASTNSNATPNVDLDNPLPSGLTGAPGRNPVYQQALLGSGVNALLQDEAWGATYQWNAAIQTQLPAGIALEVAYAGLHGSNLPVSRSINQVSAGVLAQAAADPACSPAPTANCFFTKTVANPFNRALFSQGSQQNATFGANQLYRPFPQYGAISNTGNYVGFSNYNALQAKVEKRFNSGGVLLASYTFSKLLANVESLTSWLEATGAPGYQNNNNLDAEYSLSGYDSRQRLTLAYVYMLPFGRGQKFGGNTSGFLDKLVSGYGINGVTTFQQGYPLGLSVAQNNVSTYSFAGTTRPNVVQGCDKAVGGSVQSRLGDSTTTKRYFNTACFAAPPIFTFGNESRTDNQLRAPGIANYDLAFFKDTTLTERVKLQLRVESFNLFNRVQFGGPNTSIGNANAGQITTQVNDPRLLQLAGRISF